MTDEYLFPDQPRMTGMTDMPDDPRGKATGGRPGKEADAQAAQLFPLSELQAAYLTGRREDLVLGGRGCQLYMEMKTPPLDRDRLARAWQGLIDRHDILRVVIEGADGQRVLPQTPKVTLPVVDARGKPCAEAEAMLDTLREELAYRTFDPARWPLFDVRLYRADGFDRVCFLFDLIGADAATVHHLIEDLSRAYRGDPLTELAGISYREARMTPRPEKAARALARAEAYWREALPDLPAAPDLPLVRDPGTLEKSRFVRHEGFLPQAVADALAARARAHGTTLPAVMNAAFAEVIAAWSRKRRFLVNMPIFAPPATDADRRVPLGNFTSNVLIDTDCTGPVFLDTITSMTQSVRRSLRHRAYSGLSVMRDLRIARGSAEVGGLVAPVVLTNLLAHQDAVGRDTVLGELDWGLSQTPQVMLDHQILQSNHGIAFYWDHIRELFAEGLVAGMSTAHLRLLNALAESDEAWKRPADCVPPAQMAVRAARNDTARDIASELLHRAVFDRAETTPDALALVEGDTALSYGELAGRAHAMRAKLEGAGLTPGDAAAVILEPGAAHAASVLGVLAAGGAYAPLDPSAPPDRRAQELALLRPKVIVATPEQAATLPEGGWRVVHPDDSVAPARPLAKRAPGERAYVIFTSGTTGTPKGVVMTHAAAWNTCADLVARYGLGPETRVLALSAPTFDLSVFDHFGIWAAGGAVIHPAPGQRTEPAAWLEAIERHGVTLWNSVPALMGLAVREAQRTGRKLPGLTRVMMSGDWIPPGLPAEIWQVAPRAEVVSLGGATEAAIWSLHHPIRSEDTGGASIPYGVPLANQGLHVLDDRLEPRPDGVEGELFISGVGLAEGYLGAPDLTARAFVTHPRSGQRLYRTGDLARVRTDGEVILLGRVDTQVKIQGLRVETGDVAHALAQAPDIGQVVVDAIGTQFGNKRLVAFATLAEGAGGEGGGASLPAAPEGDLKISFAPDGGKAARAALGQRRSPRGFTADVVPFADLAALLSVFVAGAVERGVKRAWPSASALYPVRAYLSVAGGRVEGVEAGFYHVGADGQLTRVAADPQAGPDRHFPHNRALAEAAGFGLMLFADRAAIEPKYGALARDLCLMEAGYIGQALTQASLDTALRICPIGAMDAGPAADAAGFGTKDFLHGFLGGVPDAVTEAVGPLSRDPVEAMRAEAKTRLPRYLRPHDYVILPEFPLTANGKIDRKALARLADPAARRKAPEPARGGGAHEQALLVLAGELMDLDEIDLDTEFFALGADSVQLVELASEVQRRFEVELDVAEVFDYPTLRALARLIAARQAPAEEAAGSDDQQAPQDPASRAMAAAKARGERRRSRGRRP